MKEALKQIALTGGLLAFVLFAWVGVWGTLAFIIKQFQYENKKYNRVEYRSDMVHFVGDEHVQGLLSDGRTERDLAHSDCPHRDRHDYHFYKLATRLKA